MKRKLIAFAVTNQGGKMLKPMNYFGYRIPVFFTKKEAVVAKEELDSKDEPLEVRKRSNGFERKVVRLEIYY